jgi:hypothetical protein
MARMNATANASGKYCRSAKALQGSRFHSEAKRQRGLVVWPVICLLCLATTGTVAAQRQASSLA